MRNFLFLLALAIFLYSPYGPSWGQFAVNMSLIVTVGSYLMKSVSKRRYYYDDEEYR
ncbi:MULTISPECIES: hypothetical protein [Hymenobacter]|uniref:hypothetical protein n=1 Tax=Hymenobacter TaxID=89966 RepID=UPI00140436DF|nr:MULTISPECIES: hypothetical protein [Hymenobacter]QIL78253.1 hypothetical protein G7064_20725 [Hymenobacter sp. HDW8]